MPAPQPAFLWQGIVRSETEKHRRIAARKTPQLLLPPGFSIFFMVSSIAFFMLSESAPWRGGYFRRLFR
jgi:hypothetical protein